MGCSAAASSASSSLKPASLSSLLPYAHSRDSMASSTVSSWPTMALAPRCSMPSMPSSRLAAWGALPRRPLRALPEARIPEQPAGVCAQHRQHASSTAFSWPTAATRACTSSLTPVLGQLGGMALPSCEDDDSRASRSWRKDGVGEELLVSSSIVYFSISLRVIPWVWANEHGCNWGG